MPITPFSDIELALTSTALAGDAGGLYRIAGQLMDDGVAFDSLLFDYLLPTERAIGSRWQQGDFLIAEEHVATATIETVISLLTGMFDQPEAGTSVVVTTAEGDDHSLPARAAAAHLLFLGYRTSFLGSNVPGPDLREFLTSGPPDALVVACAMTSHLLGARAVISAAHSADVPVVAGGEGFGPDGRWAVALGADRWVASHAEVPEVIDELVGRQQSLQAEPIPLQPQLESLIGKRAAIVAEAETRLTAEGGLLDERLRDEIRVLQNAVEAALLVGDKQVAHEMLEWQRNSLRAHDYDDSVVGRALDAALEVHAPDVAVLIGLDLNSTDENSSD